MKCNVFSVLRAGSLLALFCAASIAPWEASAFQRVCTCPNNSKAAPAADEPLPANNIFDNNGPFGDGCHVHVTYSDAGAWSTGATKTACASTQNSCGGCSYKYSRSYTRTTVKTGCRNPKNNGTEIKDDLTQVYSNDYTCMEGDGVFTPDVIDFSAANAAGNADDLINQVIGAVLAEQ